MAVGGIDVVEVGCYDKGVGCVGVRRRVGGLDGEGLLGEYE